MSIPYILIGLVVLVKQLNKLLAMYFSKMLFLSEINYICLHYGAFKEGNKECRQHFANTLNINRLELFSIVWRLANGYIMHNICLHNYIVHPQLL